MKERKRVQKQFFLPSRTRQEFKDECDLGKTISRFAKTPEGRDALANARGTLAGHYGDFTNVPDFRAAQQAVIAAEASFMALPAVVRKRFSNDAATFLDFCSDPSNIDEMRTLGLAKALEPQTVSSVESPK